MFSLSAITVLLTALIIFAALLYVFWPVLYPNAYREGTNDPDTAIQWLLRDLELAKHEVLILSGHGWNKFWGGSVAEKLRELHRGERQVKITFVVGPDYDQIPLEQKSALAALAKEGDIKLFFLPDPLPIRYRIIDDICLYACAPRGLEEKDDRQYFRVAGWRQRPIIRQARKDLERYCQPATPVQVSA